MRGLDSGPRQVTVDQFQVTEGVLRYAVYTSLSNSKSIDYIIIIYNTRHKQAEHI